MTVPPYEWPTRMAGLLTRPSARLTAATSPWTVSRQFWVDSTSCPSACSVGISLLKHEPSAHSPWTNTMLGLVCVDIMDSCRDHGALLWDHGALPSTPRQSKISLGPQRRNRGASRRALPLAVTPV